MSSLTAPTDALRIQAPLKEVVNCSHCETRVPPGLVRCGDAEQFCCEGCRTVYQMIRACQLDGYYALRAMSGTAAQPVTATAKGYEEFDDAAFQALYCTVIDESFGLSQVELYLENVHCGACIWLIERLPHILPAVTEARLDFGKHIVQIRWDHQKASLSEVARHLASLGYPPHPAKGRTQRDLRKKEDRTQLIRIAIAGAVAGNTMIISFALYGGMFSAMEPAYERLFHWTSLLLMAISVLGPGRVFFRGALAAWRTRRMHMDVPVSIGLAAGFVWSAVNAVRGSPDVYFDSLSILVFLLLLGRWIQVRQQRRSCDAVELLFSMTPSSARVVEGDQIREVPVQALRTGQIVEVRAGDSVPVDGTVVCGCSTIDASLLTGESRPTRIVEGDRAHAGIVNLSSLLRIRAESIGEATRVGQLMKLVEQGASNRAPIVKLADRIAGIFVAVILTLALATFGMWLLIDPSRAMQNSMALLIITCPCALGLATPLAIIAGIGRAAQRGILIRGSEVIERLNRAGLVLLDKTGTITQGTMTLVQWHGPDHLKPIVAAIESHSSHPLAQALARASATAAADVSNVVEHTGLGMEAHAAGDIIRVGSRRLMEHCSINIPEWIDRAENDIAHRAMTPIMVSVNNVVQVIAGVGDPVKPDARAALAALQRDGWTVGILSGDHESVVASVAEQVGINPENCRGRISPEAKLAHVQQSMRTQTVVMVGDGINDAAALAAASVGVAVKGGAEASLAAADVYLNQSGLTPLVALVKGSSRTFSVIRRNIMISLAYNTLGIGLAIGGVINPLLAAIIMPISSLTVIVLSYRSRTFEVEQV